MLTVDGFELGAVVVTVRKIVLVVPSLLTTEDSVEVITVEDGEEDDDELDELLELGEDGALLELEDEEGEFEGEVVVDDELDVGGDDGEGGSVGESEGLGSEG